MMRKSILAFIIIAMLVCFAGCVSDDKEKNTKSESEKPVVEKMELEEVSDIPNLKDFSKTK